MSRPRSSREVEGERALAGVRGEEHGSLSLQERRPPGACVVAGERLDLHDVGAERREQLRRRRAGEGGRDVDDLRADERTQFRHIASSA